MNQKTLKNSFSLPEIGLGTGGDLSKVQDEGAWKRALRDALEIGYRHIDCAAMYGKGRAEEIVGEAIQEFDRTELTISTKIPPTLLAYEDAVSSVKESLKRLDVAYVDLLYIHAHNPSIPLVETMRAMDDLVDSGLARHLAVSNFNVDLLSEAQSLTRHKIVANQIEYNLATREISHCEGCDHMESQIIPYCQENDVLVVAYRPIGRGLMSKPNELLNSLATKYNKTPTQIALNWLVSQKNIVAIPRSDHREHLQENYDASGWYLEQPDIELLRKGYPVQEVTPYRYF